MVQYERPVCPKCRKPTQFLLLKGKRDRKFQCVDCEGDDPLKSQKIARLLTGELGRSETT
jgi:hypothetical protein